MLLSTKRIQTEVNLLSPLRGESDPRVSIIIPNYNHAQYIGGAIQSVLNQNYSNFEIIVVDDGSTDNSRDVVAQFGDQVRYIWQENQGLSAARNTGIRAANGDFIGLLDADDMYEATFLASMVSILQTNSDVDAIFCGYQFVDNYNKPLGQREARLIQDGQVHEALVGGNFLVPEAMLVHRRCYYEVGLFDESLRACEDWDMWLKIAKRYRVVGTDQLLTRHRVLPGSMSSDPGRMLTNRLAVLEKHFGPEPEEILAGASRPRYAYSRAYLTTAVEYLQVHNVERAYECLYKMAAIYPDLLTKLETFYELGCGDQPKGSRHDFTTLNVTQNAIVLFDMLSKIFNEPQLLPRVWPYKREAYTNAYLALGLISYRARKLRETRGFLSRAIKVDVRSGFNRRFVCTFAKSLLGVRLITWFKLKKQEGSL